MTFNTTAINSKKTIGDIITLTSELGTTKAFKVVSAVMGKATTLDETKLVDFCGYKAHPEITVETQTLELVELNPGLAIADEVTTTTLLA